MTTDLLPMVLAGHLLGDWVVQTDWQAANKARSWSAMAQHMVGYHLTLALAVALARWPGWTHGVGWRMASLLGVSLVTHAFIDRRWPVRRLMVATGSEAFADTTWGIFVVDQALHISILCLLVAAVTR
jgi:hypothetical protein